MQFAPRSKLSESDFVYVPRLTSLFFVYRRGRGPPIVQNIGMSPRSIRRLGKKFTNLGREKALKNIFIIHIYMVCFSER